MYTRTYITWCGTNVVISDAPISNGTILVASEKQGQYFLMSHNSLQDGGRCCKVTERC